MATLSGDTDTNDVATGAPAVNMPDGSNRQQKPSPYDIAGFLLPAETPDLLNKRINAVLKKRGLIHHPNDTLKDIIQKNVFLVFSLMHFYRPFTNHPDFITILAQDLQWDADHEVMTGLITRYSTARTAYEENISEEILYGESKLTRNTLKYVGYFLLDQSNQMEASPWMECLANMFAQYRNVFRTDLQTWKHRFVNHELREPQSTSDGKRGRSQSAGNKKRSRIDQSPSPTAGGSGAIDRPAGPSVEAASPLTEPDNKHDDQVATAESPVTNYDIRPSPGPSPYASPSQVDQTIDDVPDLAENAISAAQVPAIEASPARAQDIPAAMPAVAPPAYEAVTANSATAAAQTDPAAPASANAAGAVDAELLQLIRLNTEFARRPDISGNLKLALAKAVYRLRDMAGLATGGDWLEQFLG